MSEKTELEIAKQTLKNSKDPAEREKVQQKYDALLEKDIASDKEVIAACSNGNAGSSACASARLTTQLSSINNIAPQNFKNPALKPC